MVRTLAQLTGGLALAGVAIFAAFVWSFRAKYRPVQDAIRRLNRAVTNPRQLRSAGQPGAYASIVHHVGRTSGRSYRTPVVALPTEDGFLFALPYGPGADWVRNVCASGEASVEHDGRRVSVAEPQFLPVTVANPRFTRAQQRTHRLYGVRDFLHVAAVPATR